MHRRIRKGTRHIMSTNNLALLILAVASETGSIEKLRDLRRDYAPQWCTASTLAQDTLRLRIMLADEYVEEVQNVGA